MCIKFQYVHSLFLKLVYPHNISGMTSSTPRSSSSASWRSSNRIPHFRILDYSFQCLPFSQKCTLVRDSLLLYPRCPLKPRAPYLDLRHPIVTGLIHLHASLLLPLFNSLWLRQGTGNANFFYASTLVFGMGNGGALLDAIWAGLRIAIGKLEDGYEVMQE